MAISDKRQQDLDQRARLQRTESYVREFQRAAKQRDAARNGKQKPRTKTKYEPLRRNLG